MEQHQTDINTQKDKCRLFELGIGKLRCNALWAGTQYSLGCFTSMPRQHQLQYPHRTCTITNNLCISNLSDRLIAESICEFAHKARLPPVYVSIVVNVQTDSLRDKRLGDSTYLK